MEKYTYNTENNEKLTEVRVIKVWLKEDLLPEDSDFRKMFPDIWSLIQGEDDPKIGFHFDLEVLKKLISSSSELSIVFLTTESEPQYFGRPNLKTRAYLSNRNTFKDISWLMILTNLDGCRFQIIQPPYEDFVNEFVNEVYY